jgi:hypothetical protein
MGGVIRTKGEAALDRLAECRTVVKKRFEKSVGIVYAADESRRVTALGSCIYLQVAAKAAPSLFIRLTAQQHFPRPQRMHPCVRLCHRQRPRHPLAIPRLPHPTH